MSFQTDSYSFEYGLQVFKGALAIGRQADRLGLNEARTRLEEVQSGASSAASVADSPIFAKGQELVRAEEADRAFVRSARVVRPK